MNLQDNYIGKHFGKWLVLSRDLSQKRPAKYFCRCACGVEKNIHAANLRGRHSTQCMECAAIKRGKLLIGKIHGSMTILDCVKVEGKACLYVKCQCGEMKYVKNIVNSGAYKSCGRCIKNEMIGKTIGMLKVISHDLGSNLYLCQCSCGEKVERALPALKKAKNASCGCYYKNINLEIAKSRVGKKSGLLTIVNFLGMKDGRALYSLKCKCGNTLELDVGHWNGQYSCGCVKANVPKGSDNYLAKLTEKEVISARELYATGLYNRTQLAKMLGISLSTMCSIMKKKTWKHV